MFEIPEQLTEMCEPVYIGSSNIGKRVSTKKYKQSWHVFFGYYRFGRIKRMRTRHYSKYNKRRKVQNYIFRFMAWDFYPTITRWNRH